MESSMATLKLAVFGTPRDELARTVDGEVPEWIQPRPWDLLAHTDLDDVDGQAQLEQAGVWIIARLHAPLNAQGNVHWNHGLFA